MSNGPHRPIEILLVDDDAGDVLLAIEALRQSSTANVIRTVRDGVEAMAYLRREPPYEHAERPDLVILDLNLPRMSGQEVLEQVKGDPSLRAIPVVMLTTSTSESDIAKAYQMQANLYVHKPLELEQFLEVVLKLEDLFVNVVRLPKHQVPTAR